MRVVPISHKALQTADGHRFSLDAAHALAFTLRLLRTHSATDCGQGGGAGDDLISRFKVPFLHLSDKGGNIDGDGTAAYAGFVFTI